MKRPVSIRNYSSLVELRRVWSELDRQSACGLMSAVLIVDHTFAGSLPALVRRQHPGLQLIVAGAGERLPGFVSIGELASISGSLGWYDILFERDLQVALGHARSLAEAGDEVVVFWPDWLDRAGLERGLEGSTFLRAPLAAISRMLPAATLK
jgi:hypothetical protein